MTLYLKYRPQTISELDSESVRNQLAALIKANSLPHAFLFSGPKGTGKTSTARILAKIVNCEKNATHLNEPCNECDYCKSTVKGSNFDVIEMDAASNRGIDDIRSLKEKIMLSPGSARKKIYIIDEVHMLTTEAFNALLKTLEEPPDHVLFILATTDPHKLPDTVRSRLVNIVFEKAKDDEIARSLSRVSQKEGIKIDNQTLLAIAKVADGSFRDAVKTLEQLIINVGQLTKEKVEDYLFKHSSLNPNEILAMIKEKNSQEAIQAIEKFVVGGGSVKNLFQEIFNLVHQEILQAKTTEIGNLIKLTGYLNQAASEMVYSPIAQLPLELAIIKYSQEEDTAYDQVNPKKENTNSNPHPQVSQNESKKKVDNSSLDEEINLASEEKGVKKKDQNEAQEVVVINLEKIDDANWFKILQCVRQKSASVEGFLRAAKPLGINENRAKIGVFYRFHKEQLELIQNKRFLEESISEILGTCVNVDFVLTERVDTLVKQDKKTEPSLTVANEPNIIDAAKEIFG